MRKEDIITQLNKAQKIINDCVEALSTTDISTKKSKAPKTGSLRQIDFTLNERNFVKTYSKGLSGPKKFTLLLAKTVQGKIGVDVEVKKISSKWNKMKSKTLLGYAFNVNYPTQAKTHGWVDSKKHGTYCLTNFWIKILS